MSDVERLRHVLAATGPPPDEQELRDVLWLACHVDGEPQQPDPVSEPVVPMADDRGVAPRPAAAREVPDRPAPASPPPRTPVHPAPTTERAAAGTAPKAEEVLVPTAPMLADPRGVQRALRPLKRRVPSRHRRDLDEEATAARIAESGLWAPVLVPAPERWLTLNLVVDTGPTMRLWRPLGRELAEVLVRQGAFQDVHVSYLDGERVSGALGGPAQAPGTLLDASGRHTVLVLSDCSGAHWWDGRAHRALQRWAWTGPTAILQPLPERMWRRTAAPTTPGVAVLPRPGGPNTGLRFVPFDGDVPPGVPVPVLEVAPRWFAAWADLVSGTSPQPVAVALPPLRPSDATPLEREHELPVDERVRRFLTTASPAAAELAAHVAVSVPSLPVMRLIQHRVLGGSGPGQLAEVLLSGLLRPADDVRYEFVPGAREALLDTLPRPEAQHTRHVLEAVSAEIERRAGTAAEVFRALVPSRGGRVRLTADTAPFGVVTPETRSHLTPAPAAPERPDLLDLLDAPVDELLGEDWGHRAVLPVPAGVADDGEIVRADLLGSHQDAPVVSGPPDFRRRVLQTLLLGSALRHSPAVLGFVFLEWSRESPFIGLSRLPHLTAAIGDSSPHSPNFARLAHTLQAEQRRRANVLRRTDTSWAEYPNAFPDAWARDPFPAILVILDGAEVLLNARPAVADRLVQLCASETDTGIRFLFSVSESASADTPFPVSRRWTIEPHHWAADGAVLGIGDHAEEPPALGRPATAVPRLFRLPEPEAEVHPLVDRLSRQTTHVPELPWPGEADSPELYGDRTKEDESWRGTDETFMYSPSPASDRRGGEAEEVPVVGDPDVIELNRVADISASDESPRPPVIGLDDSRNTVSPYPFGLWRDMPHGLIAGDTEARQRLLRVLTLAIAATQTPEDVSFVFAGMGEHPLGRDFDLPHVLLAEEELLGSPERLQGFLDHLSDQLVIDSTHATSVRASVLVVVDVSLTLPSSRPEVAEALLRLAQQGMGRNVALVLSSTTVDGSVPWGRLLPLLDWRIAVSPLEPSEQQRVLGRPRLDWGGERAAYLTTPESAAHRFTVARDPDAYIVDRLVRSAHERVDPLEVYRETLPAEERTVRIRRDRPPAPEGGAPPVRVAIGVDDETGEPVELDFERERHLLISGPAETSKTRLLRWLIDEVAGRAPGDRLVYVLDRDDQLLWHGKHIPDLVYADEGTRIESMVTEILWRSEARSWSGQGPDIYVFARTHRRLLGRDPLARLIPRLGRDSGLHLVLSRRQISFGAPPDPLLYSLHEVGAAAFFTRHGGGREAELWEVPPTLRRSVPRDKALLARRNEQRLIKIAPQLTLAERQRRRDGDAGGPPAWVHVTELPEPADGRIAIGVRGAAHEPVLLDFEADPHLVIVGAQWAGRSNLLRLISSALGARGTAQEPAVSVYDPSGLLEDFAAQAVLKSPVDARVRYTKASDEFVRFTAEAAARSAATESFLLVMDSHGSTGHAARLAIQAALRENPTGLHLVLALADDRSDGDAYPIVSALRDLGAPAILLGDCSGALARLYGADIPYGGGPRGRGLLIRGGEQTRFQVADVSLRH